MSFREDIITLPTGVSLDATIVTPKNAFQPGSSQQRQKLAILCHPWSWLGGSKEDPVLHELVAPFLERGHHVVLFNSRGVGKSTKWPSLTALSEADDLGQLVKVLVEDIGRKGSPVAQVVVLGYSHGSIPVSHQPTITEVPTFPNVKVSHILLSYPLSPLAFLTAFHHNTHAAALQRLVSDGNANVLVIYGDHDEFTAEGKYDTWSESLTGKAGKVEVHKVEGANHFWHGPSMRRLLELVARWIDLPSST